MVWILIGTIGEWQKQRMAKQLWQHWMTGGSRNINSTWWAEEKKKKKAEQTTKSLSQQLQRTSLPLPGSLVSLMDKPPDASINREACAWNILNSNEACVWGRLFHLCSPRTQKVSFEALGFEAPVAAFAIHLDLIKNNNRVIIYLWRRQQWFIYKTVSINCSPPDG